ncbi:dihydrofolate reductase family protein [Pseudarthrobacter sp. HLT3-5]|uniref:dihydrofolate reductase family protein n=1 Tax=Pseudarthrobacter cellobiosi TaxID=2953654 RepID=UPI00208F731F|nr:dihydrofolate reductase family protein [Pseudarthrobacter sp. HLT3-5]MCO4275863.1 dihydrofolate reductase family protein [Pseudarthrobacter sp. HLT3-5]
MTSALDSVATMGTIFGGMAVSLDGYIRSEGGDLSWLNDAMAKNEDYGFEATERRTGAYVMGANTYREMAAMGGRGSAVPTYVLSHDETLATGRKTHLYSGDLRDLVARIKSAIPEEKDICVFGGGQLITEFIELGLLDELGVAVVPVILGGGVPFFGRISEWKKLALRECRSFPSGIVLLDYQLTGPTG